MKSKKILLVFAIIFTVLSVLFGVEAIVFFLHPSDAYLYIDELKYYEGIIEKKVEYNGTYSEIYIENSEVYLGVNHQTIENLTAFDKLQPGDKIIFGLDKEGQDTFENRSMPSVSAYTLSTEKEEIIPVDACGKLFEDTEKKGKILAVCAVIVFVATSALFYYFWFQGKRKYRRLK